MIISLLSSRCCCLLITALAFAAPLLSALLSSPLLPASPGHAPHPHPCQRCTADSITSQRPVALLPPDAGNHPASSGTATTVVVFCHGRADRMDALLASSILVVAGRTQHACCHIGLPVFENEGNWLCDSPMLSGGLNQPSWVILMLPCCCRSPAPHTNNPFVLTPPRSRELLRWFRVTPAGCQAPSWGAGEDKGETRREVAR